MKICNYCFLEKEESSFCIIYSKYKGNTYGPYLSKSCNSCKKNIQKEYNTKYRQHNNAYIKESKKLYRLNNKEKLKLDKKDYYNRNKQRLLAKAKNYYKQNKEVICIKQISYRKEYRNRPSTKASRAEYQTRKNRLLNLATPKWANLDKIKNIYLQCQNVTKQTGVLHHVDHIIPLKGKEVCGLHVETNLRIIPALVNMSKGNKFTLGEM